MKTFQTHLIHKDQAGCTIEEYLKQVLQLSGRKIQQLTRSKGILLNNKPVFLQKKLKSGEQLKIAQLTDRCCGIQPQPGKVDILYEDDFLIVVNKPPFQLVHPAGATAAGTTANFLAHHLSQRGVPGTIRALHRLDRDTSGCLIFAKSAQSQTLLTDHLRSKELIRTYQALVNGVISPAAGIIAEPISLDPRRPNRRMVSPAGEPAITNYRTLQQFAKHSLLELSLETGRTHQIRVHLAHVQHGIVGDGMYGTRESWMKRQALHANAITFTQLQTKQRITVSAPLPADFLAALEYCAQVDCAYAKTTE